MTIIIIKIIIRHCLLRLMQLLSHRGSEKTSNKEGRLRMPITVHHQNYLIDSNHQTESLFFSNILASPIALYTENKDLLSLLSGEG